MGPIKSAQNYQNCLIKMQLCKMKNINTIIFDLGAVILNINYQNTINEFNKLGIITPSFTYSKQTQNDLFNQIETGRISANDFLLELQRRTKTATIKQITKAWNSMILELPNYRVTFLKSIKTQYTIYLLSNTNEIHIKAIKDKIGKKRWSEFCSLFKKTYLSHKIGLRKPNKDIFEHVLNEQNLNTHNVLFIDDSLQHIQSANKLGINTYHLKCGEEISTLFPDKVQ